MGCFHHLRLVTRCFIEAASIDEILKVRLIQGFRIRHLRQDIDIVKAVPFPHGIHPGGVRLMETVLVVFTALLRKKGENQLCQGRLVQEVKLWLWISCIPSAPAGEELV